jgi:hypothetical protein
MALKGTYKGLVNIRYVLFCLLYYIFKIFLMLYDVDLPECILGLTRLVMVSLAIVPLLRAFQKSISSLFLFYIFELLYAYTYIYYRLLHSAVIFQQNNNMANLSRVDPAMISSGHLGQTYFHQLHTPGKASIFTSVILVDACNLYEPKHMPNSKPIKSISGTLIEGEWERFVGAIGMVLHTRDFKAQLFRDNLSFTTAPSNVDGNFLFIFPVSNHY